MAEFTSPSFAEKFLEQQRISARFQVQVSWEDDASKERVSVSGTTENLSEKSVLVNLSMLPKVGDNVKIRLMDEDKTIIETTASVIRIERDPRKPQVALSIVNNVKKWKELVLTAAQDWVTRNMKLNYEGDDWLN